MNEVLLTHYLLKTEQDADARRYILNHYLDQFRTTVVRQTMFAEFEKMTHAAVEAGEALTHESLCRMYGDLNALYYGPQIARDDTISFEWSRIPHFYNAFYVYKYATGLLVCGKNRGGYPQRQEKRGQRLHPLPVPRAAATIRSSF